MKNSVIVFIAFLAVFLDCTAQKTEFTLDYTASYLLPKSQDTVKISIGNAGEYLYTDSRAITKNLESSYSKFVGDNPDGEFKMKLLVNMDNLDMLLHANMGRHTIAGNVNLSSFMKNRASDGEAHFMKSQETDEQVEVMGKKYSLVGLFPDNEPDDVLYVAFDDRYDMDYNTYFKKIFSTIIGQQFELDIPKGIVVYAKDKNGEELLRLIHIEKERQTGKIDLSLIIE